MAGAGIVMAAAAMLLAGSEWGPDSGSGIFVKFADGKASGSGGCNRFSGPYEQNDTAIRIGPLMATRMACGDEGKMQKEAAWFQLLEAARIIDASHLKLILKDASGKELTVLQRRDWD
jgi:heat shock protein HslJ